MTNIGSIGIEEGFAPLPTAIRAMFIVCTGKAEKRPVVVNDNIEIRTMLSTTYSFDHRFGDAAVLIKCLNIVKDYVEDPENFNIDKYEDQKSWEEIM